MIDVAYLLDEQTLRGVEVEVGRLTIDELTRDSSDGNDGDIGLGSLSRQFLSSELLLGGQCAGHETGQHGSLLIFLGQFLDSLFLNLLAVGDILLIGSLQLVTDGVAAILQAIEQRHHVGVVHITGTSTAGNEVV